MKKRKVILIASTIMMIFTTQVFASGNLTREYTFETSSKDFKYTKNQTIKVDGTKYKAGKTEYELINKIPGEITKEYESLTEEKIPETITEKGKKYTLKNKNFIAEKITDTDTYTNYVNAPSIPKEKEITKGDIKVNGILKDTKRELSPTYNTPFSVPAKFIGGADVSYYLLNGKQIPASSAPLFNGYKQDVLAYLNLDGNIYRVDSGSWSTGYYQDTNGEISRNAVFSGMQRTNSYIAEYEGNIYKARATYQLADGKDKYIVKAKVSYEKDNNYIFIAIGAGVLILALAISYFIYYLAKGKKKQEE